MESKQIKLEDYEVHALSEQVIFDPLELTTSEMMVKHQVDDKKTSAGIARYIGPGCEKVDVGDIVIFTDVFPLRTIDDMYVIPEGHISCVLKEKVK